ncbi:MAG: GNAT family N-acetyltransferase [Actinomycetota bacterium]|nr:GNAT family N-acetyltransferase [Actinomycetota bacterium]
MPWLPTAHSEAETRWWIEHVVLGEHDVWIVTDDTIPVGFAATRAGWLAHLYLAPEAQHRGLGRRLLSVAMQHNPGGLQLHVFQRNAGARRFYERAGFQHVADGDGGENEEGEPDSVYRWLPTAGVSS